MDGLSRLEFNEELVSLLSPEVYLSILLTDNFLEKVYTDVIYSRRWEVQFRIAALKIGEPAEVRQSYFKYSLCPVCGTVVQIKNTCLLFTANQHCYKPEAKFSPNFLWFFGRPNKTLATLLDNILKTKGSLLCYQAKNETELDYTIL